jgi:hypothetical protein
MAKTPRPRRKRTEAEDTMELILAAIGDISQSATSLDGMDPYNDIEEVQNEVASILEDAQKVRDLFDRLHILSDKKRIRRLVAVELLPEDLVAFRASMVGYDPDPLIWDPTDEEWLDAMDNLNSES